MIYVFILLSFLAAREHPGNFLIGPPLKKFGHHCFRSLIAFSLTWAIGTFFMICLDRMLAIFFPLKMINYGYKSATSSSLVMCFLCLILVSPFYIASRFVKIGFQIVCTPFAAHNFTFREFINTWCLLFVLGGAVPISLILTINILLIWKVVVYKNNVKTLVESVNLTARKELKATILVLILSVFFLIGNIIYFSVCLAIFLSRILLSADQSVKVLLQTYFNILDISIINTFLMKSINILIYYAKMKRFRVECNKIFYIKYIFT